MNKSKERLMAFFVIVALIISSQIAWAKRWTIYQRQVRLMNEINMGQKSGELTLKEANELRNKEEKIDNKIAKMKEKNGGKISYADQNKLEKMLNELSVQIQKKKLEKRVER